MLGRYVATERDVCSVATWRPSLARARSLRSDRATFFGFSPMSRVSSAGLFRLSGVLLPMAFYMGVEGRLRVVIS
ncbi:hypothetical protein F2Q70_00029278 [Brassica cretica]|uniref:Uncharacterized protein n=2 Tax=Brassica cretica TaxID=69181 RepID=A0A8S9FDV6_BRACR|nr:hypothetical protein F2Q70_00029278 [Brassica cretica]KAF2551364.1 hypothetical protein F2Q68_00033642 [Brassica cretica]KAF3597624.1 hypothetical protein DY000_02020666 [Brassica cretica]